MLQPSRCCSPLVAEGTCTVIRVKFRTIHDVETQVVRECVISTHKCMRTDVQFEKGPIL